MAKKLQSMPSGTVTQLVKHLDKEGEELLVQISWLEINITVYLCVLTAQL